MLKRLVAELSLDKQTCRTSPGETSKNGAPPVPVEMRQTGMEGARNGQGKKAHASADCERSAADRSGDSEREDDSGSEPGSGDMVQT